MPEIEGVGAGVGTGKGSAGRFCFSILVFISVIASRMFFRESLKLIGLFGGYGSSSLESKSGSGDFSPAKAGFEMTTVFGGSSTSSTALCMGFLLPSVVEMTVGFGEAGFEMTEGVGMVSENS